MNNLTSGKDIFRFWLIHEKLTYDHICILARGEMPTQINISWHRFIRIFNNCRYYSLLMSAISIKAIKSANNGGASPLESFMYFKSKGLPLPNDLSYLLEHQLDEIQADLKKKIKRSKESYQRKEVRGDDDILNAVLKTLLDLSPDCSKEEIILLKPVQIYANGSRHSEASLIKKITDIERVNQKSRKKGNKTNEIKDSVKREIPNSWRPESYLQDS